MRIKIFLSVLFGTILLFVWNAFSWTALPLHTGAIQSLPPFVLDTSNMQKVMPSDGVYQYPAYPAENEPAHWEFYEKKLQRGPRITLLVYKAEGSTTLNAKTLLTDLIINFFTVVFLIIILDKQADKSFSSIWSTCVILGAIIGLASHFAQMNWYLFPLDYTVAKAFDHLIAFTLLGLFFGNFTFKTKENFN